MVLWIFKKYTTRFPSKLRNLLNSRVPIILSSQLTSILCHTSRQTPGKRSSLYTIAKAGVPQYDPISPLLTDLFMDSYLEYLNSFTFSVVCSSADDVVLQSKLPDAHNDMLTISTVWSSWSGMRWDVAKSQDVCCDGTFLLQGSTARIKRAPTYLGVIIAYRGMLDRMLISNFDKAQKALRHLL